METQDYLLFALVFFMASLFMFALQWQFLRGESPAWSMASTAWVFGLTLSGSFLIAGILKRIFGTSGKQG